MRAAQIRFALAFPVLLWLSLSAHLVAGGTVPGIAGLLAGATFAALCTALAVRRRLTVLGLSSAALVSQLAVHWSFELVTTLGPAGHAHHRGSVLDTAAASAAELSVVSGHASHGMFTSPMLLAHGAAAVIVAVILVRIDGFLAYVRSAVEQLVTVLRSQTLIAHRPPSVVFLVDKIAGLPTLLGPLTKRGPPALPRYLSNTSAVHPHLV